MAASLTIAIIAPGAMGAATAARLHENGMRVLTSLEGRSAASAARAKAAGMIAATDVELGQADIVLSIVPPGDALTLAQRLLPVLAAVEKKPVYADCNAVNPDTVKDIAAVIARTGCGFVDGGIIGGPPRKGYDGPVFYLSGEVGAVAAVARLEEYGLVTRVLDGPVGAASALKMSYAGITKGLTAIGSAMMLAAARAGAAEALKAELAHSQPNLLAYFTRSVPDMYPKAYRWVAEMEEIARFNGDVPGRAMYEAIAAHYQMLANDHAGERSEIDALTRFFDTPQKES